MMVKKLIRNKFITNVSGLKLLVTGQIYRYRDFHDTINRLKMKSQINGADL